MLARSSYENTEEDGADESVQHNGGLKQDLSGCFSAQRWKYPTASEARALSWITVFGGVPLFVWSLLVLIFSFNVPSLGVLVGIKFDVTRAVVLKWRFTSGSEIKALASVLLSFLVAAIAFLTFAIFQLALDVQVKSTAITASLLLVSLVFYLLVGSVKLFVSLLLDSAALKADAVCFLAQALLCVGGLISLLMPNVTYVYSIFAFVMAVCLFAPSFLRLRRIPWRSRAFWSSGSPLETDEEKVQDQSEEGIDLKPIDIDMI